MLAGAAARVGSGVPPGDGPIEAARAIAILRQAVTMGFPTPAVTGPNRRRAARRSRRLPVTHYGPGDAGPTIRPVRIHPAGRQPTTASGGCGERR